VHEDGNGFEEGQDQSKENLYRFGGKERWSINMIEIYQDGKTSAEIGKPYSHSGKMLGRVIMPITSRLRARYGLQGILGTQSHLDIGCGDGLFLKKSPCRKRIGLDIRYGDCLSNQLAFPDQSFENVSMLAVIEHLEYPRELIKEIHRIMTPGGHLILTTPKKLADWLISLYSKDTGSNTEHGHEMYYDQTTMNHLIDGFFTLKRYQTFLFGLNQLFICEKKDTASNP
jgi:SAM-dependent methyltransferase